jgi:SAM-dependent methyltransferase
MPSIFRRALAVTRTHLEIARAHRTLPVPLNSVDLADLRRTSPLSRDFGLDRGTPISRYYAERFLAENHSSAEGRVLEVSDPAAAVGLTHASDIADATFDRIILTLTLQFVFEIGEAVSEVHRILKPGGTLLCTVPGISQIRRDGTESPAEYWRLTSASARRLFDPLFGADRVEVTTYGNLLSATAFLYGMAASELTGAELDERDDDYQVVVAVRAVKADE